MTVILLIGNILIIYFNNLDNNKNRDAFTHHGFYIRTPLCLEVLLHQSHLESEEFDFLVFCVHSDRCKIFEDLVVARSVAFPELPFSRHCVSSASGHPDAHCCWLGSFPQSFFLANFFDFVLLVRRLEN